MIFKRRRLKGAPKTHKEWLSEDKQYRVHWRSHFAGIEVIPAYYACARCTNIPDGWEYWGFTGRQGTYKTFKAAVKGCEDNLMVWEQFLAIEGRGKVSQFRELQANYIKGTALTGRAIFRDVPTWVIHKADARLMHILQGKKIDD